MIKYINISNALSLSRIFLLYPFYFYYGKYIDGESTYLFTVFLISFFMVISDYLDGFFARKLNQITELGKILDPVADKIGIAGVSIILYLKSGLPFWILAVIIGRDILIVLGALFLAKKIKQIPSSEWPGKITVFILSILLVAYIFEFNSIKFTLLILSAVSITYSFLDYLFKFIKLIEKE
jgi:cardiolipin synthase (CMP-forming)